MKRLTIAFLGTFAHPTERLTGELNDRDYESAVATDDDVLVDLLAERGGGVAAVGYEGPDGALETVRRVRNEIYSVPVQLLLCGMPRGEVQQLVDAGADDVMPETVDPREFAYRLRAAFIRLREQLKVSEERDFFRDAARQEEELSSRILDQHLILKEAFRSIEDLNKELEESNHRLEKIARLDVLSGLLNRMSLFSTIDMEIERSQRTRMPLSGIMLDIDNFKSINDTYGHLAGDQVIHDAALKLKSHLRKYDQAGRYGGEEFFVLLPNANLHQSDIIAERIRSDFAQSSIAYEDQSIRLTASFGIAEYRNGEPREHWLRRSDRNMYVAKEQGRNRVIAE